MKKTLLLLIFLFLLYGCGAEEEPMTITETVKINETVIVEVTKVVEKEKTIYLKATYNPDLKPTWTPTPTAIPTPVTTVRPIPTASPTPIPTASPTTIPEQTYNMTALKPGMNEDIIVQHDSIDRFVSIALPSNYDSSKSYPLIIGFHGAINFGKFPEDTTFEPQDSFTNMGGLSGVQDFVNDFQFIAVSPAGFNNARGNSGLMFGWNSFEGHRISKADDVGFALAVIDMVRKTTSIDDKRIFATGHSSGAIFTYKLAKVTNKFRAIAPTAGLLVKNLLELSSTQPQTSVLEVHGSEDTVVPYNGGGSVPREQFYSVDRTLKIFSELNGCGPESDLIYVEDDVLEWSEYPDCDSDLRIAQLTLRGFGHGFKDRTIDVSRKILEFFLETP